MSYPTTSNMALTLAHRHDDDTILAAVNRPDGYTMVLTSDGLISAGCHKNWTIKQYREHATTCDYYVAAKRRYVLRVLDAFETILKASKLSHRSWA